MQTYSNVVVFAMLYCWLLRLFSSSNLLPSLTASCRMSRGREEVREARRERGEGRSWTTSFRRSSWVQLHPPFLQIFTFSLSPTNSSSFHQTWSRRRKEEPAVRCWNKSLSSLWLQLKISFMLKGSKNNAPKKKQQQKIVVEFSLFRCSLNAFRCRKLHFLSLSFIYSHTWYFGWRALKTLTERELSHRKIRKIWKESWSALFRTSFFFRCACNCCAKIEKNEMIYRVLFFFCVCS